MPRRIALAVATSLTLLIGVVAAPTASAARSAGARSPISFNDFTLVGGAQVIDGRLRLTASEGWQAGGGWLTDQQTVGSGFRVAFTYQFRNPPTGADGFAFVIQDEGLSALGGWGGYLGYGETSPRAHDGITRSVAVEFDTWYNPDFDDPYAPHVSVHTRGIRSNSANEAASIGMVEAPSLVDGQKHHVVIKYVEPRLRVFLDGVQILLVRVHLGTKLDLTGGSAWVGFTAGTGSATAENWITRFAYTPR